MRYLVQLLTRTSLTNTTKASASLIAASKKPFSTRDRNNDNKDDPDWVAHFGSSSSEPDPLGWETGSSSWSTGLTKEHFDGKVVGQMVPESVLDPNTGTNLDARFTSKEWIDIKRLMKLDDVKVSKEDAKREQEETERLVVQVSV